MLTVPAPAKLNLTLEVLGERPDGFHEIISVIQTTSLSDRLSFRASDVIEFKCTSPGWAAEKSLVARATGLLQETTGCSRGVSIEIEKHIPLLSGLGGDSSDAAAVLCGLNRLWEAGLSTERLRALAAQLGSDVPFFLYGGTALVEGRGEKVTPLPTFPHHWIVLVIPSLPVLQGKTKRLYDSLNPVHFTDGKITQRMVETLKSAGKFTSSFLFNSFEQVASTQFPGLDTCREQMAQAGATEIPLAGSGPALFTLTQDENEAEGLYQRLRQQGQECYLAETLSAIDR
ncbi:MAG: 4-(cytidine 5'-diphospho)-2-C-methyl-D-erythritol kinase [Dehalococcoidales bacterium]|nr:4-(cytidine 5'-diphospho)-2-C-methyl-D-erythritol kinase [Dehalococcoidales bacterium]